MSHNTPDDNTPPFKSFTSEHGEQQSVMGMGSEQGLSLNQDSLSNPELSPMQKNSTAVLLGIKPEVPEAEAAPSSESKKTLKVSVGQYSTAGAKEVNQDFHGIYIPKEPELSRKGIAIALADGISSSQVSQVASETAVKSFLDDYYSTSDAWSVRKSAQQVLKAVNAWLHSQTQRSDLRFEMDKGFVCTFSALVIKSNTAHLFHVGDSRIYRMQDNQLEQLTQDHRLVISPEVSYLSRALGFDSQLDLDIRHHKVVVGDLYILATDGVYDYLDEATLKHYLRLFPHDLDTVASALVQHALNRGSDDNLTIQLVQIDELPDAKPNEIFHDADYLPPAPVLEPPCVFDGLEVIRQLHANSRSHVYLARFPGEDTLMALKVPSDDQREQPGYLEQFLLEEWVARRISSPHVLKPILREHKRHYLYTLTEYIEGENLTQWRHDHPEPSLDQVRNIITQVARGLQSFHRLEMLHQDIRPENILIDRQGTVRIIDFGSTYVSGLAESAGDPQSYLAGTALYAAPEYFLGEAGSARSDQFSLAVLTYYLLSGDYPYGAEVPRAKSRSAQYRLIYQSVTRPDSQVPAWVDEPLKKALQPDPYKRFDELSEFVFALGQPSKKFLNRTKPPLLERNPVAFWQSVSGVLLILVLYLLSQTGVNL